MCPEMALTPIMLAAIAQAGFDLPCAVITAFGNADNAVVALKVCAFTIFAKPVSAPTGFRGPW